MGTEIWLAGVIPLIFAVGAIIYYRKDLYIVGAYIEKPLKYFIIFLPVLIVYVLISTPKDPEGPDKDIGGPTPSESSESSTPLNANKKPVPSYLEDYIPEKQREVFRRSEIPESFKSSEIPESFKSSEDSTSFRRSEDATPSNANKEPVPPNDTGDPASSISKKSAPPNNTKDPAPATNDKGGLRGFFDEAFELISEHIAAMGTVFFVIIAWQELKSWKRKQLGKSQIEWVQKVIISFADIQAVIVYICDKDVRDEELKRIREYYKNKEELKDVKDESKIDLLTKVLVPNYRVHEMQAKIKEFSNINAVVCINIHNRVYTYYKDAMNIVNDIITASEERFKLIKEAGSEEKVDLKKLDELNEIVCVPFSLSPKKNIYFITRPLRKINEIRKIGSLPEDKVDEIAKRVKSYVQVYINRI